MKNKKLRLCLVIFILSTFCGGCIISCKNTTEKPPDDGIDHWQNQTNTVVR